MKEYHNKISPSILAADFTEIGKAVDLLAQVGADYVHCDVMDGNYVPSITFGAQMVSAIHKRTSLPLDVHLMIVEPERHVADFAAAGAHSISFHPETCFHPHRLLMEIGKLGCKRAIVLNPGSSVTSVSYLLEQCDMVLLMSVNPGAGGQSFIPATLQKARELVEIRKAANLDFEIEIDGGIDKNTAPLARDAGVNVLVTGSAFFGSDDKKKAVRDIRGH